MFDDMFHKLCETGEYEVVIGSILNNIFEQNRDCCVEKQLGKYGELIYSPTYLDEAWLDEPE